ncbi:two-component system sensor histidine kinase NtrB [Parvularcula marina]|uniref:histidine kinase n=1 Tax=Parvularcula marina TaxID=2292771 RepID=A0A371RJQ2_9PROT|nr:ATP-binding protein [Parvularcula marina]RFB05665.1 PAS domain-containing protein [Parvularcula marina]
MTSHPAPPAEKVLEVMEQAGIGHALTDPQGVILYQSEAFSRLGGLSSTPIAGIPWFRLDNASEERKDMRALVWQQFISRKVPWHGIVHWHITEEKIHFYEGTGTHLDDGSIVVVLNDRTSKVLADKKVEDTISFYSQVLRDLPIALAVTDLEGRVTYMNDFLPERLDLTANSFVGKTLSDSFGNGLTELAEREAQNFMRYKDYNEGVTLELQQKDGVGTWLAFARPLFDAKGERVATLNLAIDRSESHRLREEHARLTEAMYEAQKISALNDFAGNLAHELSNILHPVAFYARKLTGDATREQCTEYSQKINKGVMTAGQILRRTLSLAGRSTDSPEPCDLRAILEETLSSARDLAPNGLEYEAHLPTTPMLAAVSRSGFSQILLNLLNNAAEAMNYAGTVTISLDHVSENLPGAFADKGMTEAICLRIEDEGPGIDPAIIDRLFEAFVTTKTPGRGVGLGLSVVKGLATSWGGLVTATSLPEKGAAFSVWIPSPSME